MMRRLVVLTLGFVVAAVVHSCRGNRTVDFAAANAAKDYYDLLVDERCEAFVEGMNFTDPITKSYRQQLVDNVRMFVGEQKQEHKGIREVRVVNCVNDSLQPEANAFLMLCFGDSTIEEVVVPMVKRDGKWWMK